MIFWHGKFLLTTSTGCLFVNFPNYWPFMREIHQWPLGGESTGPPYKLCLMHTYIRKRSLQGLWQVGLDRVVNICPQICTYIHRYIDIDVSAQKSWNTFVNMLDLCFFPVFCANQCLYMIYLYMCIYIYIHSARNYAVPSAKYAWFCWWKQKHDWHL